MPEEISFAAPATGRLDTAGARQPRSFSCGKCLDIGSVALLQGIFYPSAGGPVRFPKVTLAIHDSAPLRLDWRPPDSDRLRSRTIYPGGAMLVGGGVPVWKRWTAPRSIFAIAVDKDFFSEISQQLVDGATNQAVETAIGIADSTVARLAALGRRELDEDGFGGRLYLEGLASYLTMHIAQRYGGIRRATRAPKGGLTPRQVRRVADYIEARVSTELGLIELAAIAGLSPHHFGEAFKASTGLSPHRFVTERRIGRARDLLRDHSRGLAEIADMLGFSSQAHFTTQFRRLTGITPGHFRRELS